MGKKKKNGKGKEHIDGQKLLYDLTLDSFSYYLRSFIEIPKDKKNPLLRYHPLAYYTVPIDYTILFSKDDKDCYLYMSVQDLYYDDAHEDFNWDKEETFALVKRVVLEHGYEYEEFKYEFNDEERRVAAYSKIDLENDDSAIARTLHRYAQVLDRFTDYCFEGIYALNEDDYPDDDEEEDDEDEDVRHIEITSIGRSTSDSEEIFEDEDE